MDRASGSQLVDPDSISVLTNTKHLHLNKVLNRSARGLVMWGHCGDRSL